MNCQHGPCTCEEAHVIADGKSYCGPDCASAADMAPGDAACPCGHAGCDGAAAD